MGKLWYILTVKSDRVIFAHDLIEGARSEYARARDTVDGFECYTPCERKTMTFTSRKARQERRAPVVYVEPLFRGFLFVGSSKPRDEALYGLTYIMDRRSDIYAFVADHGEPVSMTDAQMSAWQARLREQHKKRRNFLIRGYDKTKDTTRKDARVYGHDLITLPEFSRGEIVRFVSGGFQGLTAEISDVGDAGLSVITSIFGSVREIKQVDPFEIQKIA